LRRNADAETELRPVPPGVYENIVIVGPSPNEHGELFVSDLIELVGGDF
jgi:hypothetical protein